VSNQDGKTIALFRGKSYRIKGEVIAGLPAAQQGPHKEHQYQQRQETTMTTRTPNPATWSPSRPPAATNCRPCSCNA
jgi:hypothetical protein